MTVRPATSMTRAPVGQSADAGGSTLVMRLRSMTRVPSRAGAPVPSKILPPRRTIAPSGPWGPGATGTRRGSSLVGVPGASERRRSEARVCAIPGAADSNAKATNRRRVFISGLPLETRL